MALYIGVDPGVSGGIAAVTHAGQVLYAEPFTTIGDMRAFVTALDPIAERELKGSICCLENVHAMPKQGVASTFKFGRNFGQWEGMLSANRIPVVLVTPAKWQKQLGCLSRGDKNVTKAAAQRLFPQVPKITHATADALLLAEYCRRMYAVPRPLEVAR